MGVLPQIALAFVLLSSREVVGANSIEQAVQTGTPAQEAEMVATADPIISLIDAGNFAETYKSVGPPIAAKTDKNGWVSYLTALRNPLGAMKQRDVKGFGFYKELNGAPGEFAVIGYETQFEYVHPIEEKLVFQKRAGKWELVGYWLKKRIITFGEDQP